jgi:hypothetical protein
MKLLFENWRKFLLNEIEIVDDDEQDIPYDPQQDEQERLGSLEKKYLGVDADTITQIAEVLLGMTPNAIGNLAPKAGMSFNSKKQYIMDKFGVEISNPQSGAYRTTYGITDDIVIKIAVNKFGFKMNKDDYVLATEGGIGSIFPKYYASPGCDEGCSWLAMERVTPMTNLPEEQRSLAHFFPSTILKTPQSHNERDAYMHVLAACVSHKKVQYWIKQEVLEMINFNRREKFRSIPYNKLYYDFKYNSKNFQSLIDLISKYPKIKADEMLANTNCGVASDGRFVVLDSSFFG